ncbi:glycosyltransferase family 9 protein [Uliginosibacterium sp. 31-12]|uniref:glycosyltransferase family 9 protein n=1 Tax=Uliginosibacterium sp. 31-12 TaxID=3062781 RepID=UPI0026E318B6|nr:glycosyltransferase family 9 protein [Uliginosibacterium sp. 31-12]MDO6384975.1 glycosyltransferase family 9 protein [Uliginosibacterium sp. 31-12]
MMKIFERFFSRFGGAVALSAKWVEHLRSMDLERMRAAFQVAAGSDVLPDFSALRDKAVALGWSGVMLDKLCAYRELYGSEVSQGYQRVLVGGLAHDDFKMMLVAVARCYEFQRYVEAWQIFSDFDRRNVPAGEESEYLGQGIALVLASRRDIVQARIFADEAMEHGYLTMFLAMNACVVYFELGDHAKVRVLEDFMVQGFSTSPYVLQSLGWLALARGYYGEGFRLLEARQALPELRVEVPAHLWERERWTGETVKGQRLLVYEEQGIGDAVMMARYLAELNDKGFKVLFAARQQIISLLEGCMPYVEYVVRSPRNCAACEFDRWVPMMSLPHFMNTVVFNVPRRRGFLAAPDEQRAYWRERVGEKSARGGLRVGIAWSGNPDHKFDKRRSLAFSEVEPGIRSLPGVDFYALQTSTPDIYPGNLYVMSEEFTTLSDTAALIELMDIVISVDTSVVHLAGALGKQTLLMLPYRYEWRWGLEGETNPWYESVRVLRQSRHADWSDVLARVFEIELPKLSREGVH